MNHKIMVVDDEETIVEYLKTGLEFMGFTVVSTTTALKAIEMAHNEKPDLIVLDFVMPGIDGYSIYHGLESSNITRNIPVIFMTGYMTKDMQEKISKTKSCGYLLKPFEIHSLSDRIKKILLKQ